MQVLDACLGVPPDDIGRLDPVMAQDLVQDAADPRIHGPNLALEAMEQARIAAEQVAADVPLGLRLAERLVALDHLRRELLEVPGGRELDLRDEVAVVVDVDVAQQDALLVDIVLHDPAAQVVRTARAG